MDILITYADGATEQRPGDSACLATIFEPPPKHPSEERWYLYFPGEALPLSFCAITVRPIESVRAFRNVYVWRLTGHTEEPYTLTGEWQSCNVETVDEQIARLTRERDDARECACRLAALDFNEAPSLHDASLVAAYGGARR